MRADTQASASESYKQRYVAYEKIYRKSWPKPPVQPGGGSNAVAGSQSSVLKRQVRHNDKSTTQNSSVKGATNATK
jgi:hypothetical protein